MTPIEDVAARPEAKDQAQQEWDIRIRLDRLYPRAQHGEVVEYQGKRYRRRYFPEQLGRSGWSVRKWGRTWDVISG